MPDKMLHTTIDLQASHSAPADWDEYVSRHAESTAYHRAATVLIGSKAFGLRTWFVVARRASVVVGVLPLVEQSSLLFGRFLVSVPFFTYGGILADSAEVADDLAGYAAKLGQQLKVDHVELRHRAEGEHEKFKVRLDKVSLMLGLPGSEEALGKQLGSKLRSQIRRAERENPEVLWGGAELIPDFYRVFASGMHQLGTPVYPQRFFDEACRAMEGLIGVLVIKVRGEVQAGAIVVRHGTSIEVPWAAATPEAKRNAINMRMYWEMLCYSIARQARTFDFGRSTVDSGTYRFKQQWGAQPAQLFWHYWLPAGRPIPQLNASNPKYAMASTLWRKMPLWCANLLGPQIVRHLP